MDNFWLRQIKTKNFVIFGKCANCKTLQIFSDLLIFYKFMVKMKEFRIFRVLDQHLQIIIVQNIEKTKNFQFLAQFPNKN